MALNVGRTLWNPCGGPSHPYDPYPGIPCMPCAHDLKVVRDGEKLVSAEIGGVVLAVERSAPKGFSSAQLVLRKGARTYLSLAATISHPANSIKMETADDEIRLSYEIKIERGSTRSHIAGTTNDDGFSGVLDLETGRSPFNLGFDCWWSDATKRQLAPFARLLADEYFAVEKQLQQPPPIPAEGPIGRALCWGLGGAAAAIACAGTFGLGCIGGAFIAGAAASLCAEGA